MQEEAKHQRIIAYCGGGIAATVNAIAHLIAGDENVAVYDGSMDESIGEGLSITMAAVFRRGLGYFADDVTASETLWRSYSSMVCLLK